MGSWFGWHEDGSFASRGRSPCGRFNSGDAFPISSAALRPNRLESVLILIYSQSVPWDVRLWPDVESWILGLDDLTYHLVAAAITRLEAEGPRLGRPTADRIKGSRHHNMKELRPGSAGHSEIRILFAFDPKRRAILLTAGDKSGRWKRWYDQNIPIADDRFDEWLESEEE